MSTQRAQAVIDPVELRRGVARLAALDTPSAIRLTLGHSSLELTRYHERDEWWTTTAVAASPRSARSASVVVSLSVFQYALEDLRGVSAVRVSVWHRMGVRIGAWSFDAAPESAVPLPEDFPRWKLADPEVALPTCDDSADDTRVRFDGGIATVARASLRRMARRGVTVARVFLGGGHAFLVGAADDDASVMMFARASLDGGTPREMDVRRSGDV